MKAVKLLSSQTRWKHITIFLIQLSVQIFITFWNTLLIFATKIPRFILISSNAIHLFSISIDRVGCIIFIEMFTLSLFREFCFSCFPIYVLGNGCSMQIKSLKNANEPNRIKSVLFVSIFVQISSILAIFGTINAAEWKIGFATIVQLIEKMSFFLVSSKKQTKRNICVFRSMITR